MSRNILIFLLTRFLAPPSIVCMRSLFFFFSLLFPVAALAANAIPDQGWSPLFDLSCTSADSCYWTGCLSGAAVMLFVVAGFLANRQCRFLLWLTFGYKPASPAEKIRREEQDTPPQSTEVFWEKYKTKKP